MAARAFRDTGRGKGGRAHFEIPGEEEEAGSDPVRLAQVPFQYAAGKLNPVMRDVAGFLQARDTNDFLKKVFDSIKPMMVQNSSPSASLSPFEQGLGIRGAPAAVTGAPHTALGGGAGWAQSYYPSSSHRSHHSRR
jgi:hypothetical protein